MQVHKAALGRVHGERGLGLRFPRFLRRREDKSLEDATSAEQLADMFNAQVGVCPAVSPRLR
jgi:DNA ligase-1